MSEPTPPEPTPTEPAKRSPFGVYDYQFAFGALGIKHEVTISGVLAKPLSVGEVYTFNRPEGAYDVIVREVVRTEGAWSARCDLIEPRIA